MEKYQGPGFPADNLNRVEGLQDCFSKVKVVQAICRLSVCQGNEEGPGYDEKESGAQSPALPSTAVSPRIEWPAGSRLLPGGYQLPGGPGGKPPVLVQSHPHGISGPISLGRKRNPLIRTSNVGQTFDRQTRALPSGPALFQFLLGLGFVGPAREAVRGEFGHFFEVILFRRESHILNEKPNYH